MSSLIFEAASGALLAPMSDLVLYESSKATSGI